MEGVTGFHDLARDFAAQRLETEERELAARRRAGHYLEVLREADRMYKEGGEDLLAGAGCCFFTGKTNGVR